MSIISQFKKRNGMAPMLSIYKTHTHTHTQHEKDPQTASLENITQERETLHLCI